MLNKIVYTIPKEVQLTEIKNEEKGGKQHIYISAQSKKYEQLAYFKAKLRNDYPTRLGQGWKPDWTSANENKYCIINEINKITIK